MRPCIGIAALLLVISPWLCAYDISGTFVSGLVDKNKFSGASFTDIHDDKLEFFLAGVEAQDYHLPAIAAAGLDYNAGPVRFALQSLETTPLNGLIPVPALSAIATTAELRFQQGIVAGSVSTTFLGFSNTTFDLDGFLPINITNLGGALFRAGLAVDSVRLDALYAPFSGKADFGGIIPLGSLQGSLWAATVSVPNAGIAVFDLDASLSSGGTNPFLNFFLSKIFTLQAQAHFLGSLGWLNISVPVGQVKLGLDLYGGLVWSLGFTSQWIYSGSGADFFLISDPAWVVLMRPSVDIPLDKSFSLDIGKLIPLGHLWDVIKTPTSTRAGTGGGPSPSSIKLSANVELSDPVLTVLLSAWQLSLSYSFQ